MVYLDVAGLRGLFGDDAEIGRRLVGALAERGLRARVGIGGSRISALVGARRGDGVAVIPPGEDARHLAPAPVSLLELTQEMAARLGRWGIRTLGELADLPAHGLFERLGSDGLRLQRLARGEDPRPLRPWAPPPAFEESVDAAWGVEALGPLNDLMGGLVERICSQLERRGLSADQLEWTFQMAGGLVHDGSVTPAGPMSEAAVVSALIRASLEAKPPRGAVERITLQARPVRVAPAQESLTDRSRPSPRMLAATLARLAALVGENQVGIPRVLDTHASDPLALSPQGRGQGEGRLDWSAEPRPTLALRRLRPPLPARVTITAGRPVHVHSDRLTGAIVASAGPSRSSGEWWTERAWLHDEWDAELSDGTLCRLANDGSAWSLEGIYD